MIIHRVSNAALTDHAQVGYHLLTLAKYKRVDFEYQLQLEAEKLSAMQESRRLLRNYNYMKDTEFLTQYAFSESIKEQRLLRRADSLGLYIDQYI
jgi:hypothetical protein